MAVGVLLTVLGVASLAAAAGARLKTDATVYARPSTSSEVVGRLAAGARVEVLGESGGWREVETAAGRGFVRGEQLVVGEPGAPTPRAAERATERPGEKAAQKPSEKPAEKAADPPPERRAAEKPAARPAPAASSEDLQRLTDEVRMLRERPEPATLADLGRVETALTEAIAANCAKPAVVAAEAPPHTSVESMLAVSPVLLLVGGVAGWAAGRVMQRRRDHRHRIRL